MDEWCYVFVVSIGFKGVCVFIIIENDNYKVN